MNNEVGISSRTVSMTWGEVCDIEVRTAPISGAKKIMLDDIPTASAVYTDKKNGMLQDVGDTNGVSRGGPARSNSLSIPYRHR